MKIKSLLVMPNKEAQIMKIPANIKFIKSLIGDELYRVRLDERNILIANKNAEIGDFNRILGDKIILGTFLIVSVKNKHRISMKKKDIRKYTNSFKLRKHQKKINMYKDEFLEDYYTNQKIRKIKNTERNRKVIFDLAA